MKEQKGEVERKKKETQRQADENFGDSKMGKLRTLVWNLMEYPETSRAAQVSISFSLQNYVHGQSVPTGILPFADFCLGLSGDGVGVHIHLYPWNTPWLKKSNI